VYLYVKCMDCGAILNESEDGRRLRAGCPGFKAERYASGSCEHCHHDAQYHCDSLRSRLAEAEALRETRAKELSYVVEACTAALVIRTTHESRDAMRDLRAWATNRIDAHLAREQSHV
jgi:hypothetical protein